MVIVIQFGHTSKGTDPKQESVPFSFVPLWFAKKILDDLHLPWREAALVGFVTRVRKGLQKAAGFRYLFPEGSYGGLVCASGIVTHGKVAKLVADSALWPCPCSCGFLCCKRRGLLFSVTYCHVVTL